MAGPVPNLRPTTLGGKTVIGRLVAWPAGSMATMLNVVFAATGNRLSWSALRVDPPETNIPDGGPGTANGVAGEICSKLMLNPSGGAGAVKSTTSQTSNPPNAVPASAKVENVEIDFMAGGSTVTLAVLVMPGDAAERVTWVALDTDPATAVKEPLPSRSIGTTGGIVTIAELLWSCSALRPGRDGTTLTVQVRA